MFLGWVIYHTPSNRSLSGKNVLSVGFPSVLFKIGLSGHHFPRVPPHPSLNPQPFPVSRRPSGGGHPLETQSCSVSVLQACQAGAVGAAGSWDGRGVLSLLGRTWLRGPGEAGGHAWEPWLPFWLVPVGRVPRRCPPSRGADGVCVGCQLGLWEQELSLRAQGASGSLPGRQGREGCWVEAPRPRT